MIEETGSFRDPAGKIFYHKNKVLRKLSASGKERFDFLIKEKILNKSIEKNFLINTKVFAGDSELKNDKNNLILEHENVPYISYPYEWSFNQLKDAALFHLDFNLFLLNLGATLIDSSAYNIQFQGSKPIFIDVLSIEKYKEGEPWVGHKQFCENFLNPLILKSKKGIKFNNWFKGNLEGIETDDLDKILSVFDKFSYNIFTHVYLLNKLDQKFKSNKSLKPINKKKFFSKKSLILILKQLKKFIANLEDHKSISTWDDYSKNNSYSELEENKKKEVVERFIKKNNFNLVADLGCNDGEYSELSLKNGSENVIGFDFDINAIDKAYQLDARLCIAYLTIELKGSIPEDLRPLIGNRIFGCDDCQLACPWIRFSKSTSTPDFQPRHSLDNATLASLFSWSESEFNTRLEGSPIRRIGYQRWLRNIAVALGNSSRTTEALVVLEEKRAVASPMVREHIEWAIARLNDHAAEVD